MISVVPSGLVGQNRTNQSLFDANRRTAFETSYVAFRIFVLCGVTSVWYDFSRRENCRYDEYSPTPIIKCEARGQLDDLSRTIQKDGTGRIRGKNQTSGNTETR